MVAMMRTVLLAVCCFGAALAEAPNNGTDDPDPCSKYKDCESCTSQNTVNTTTCMFVTKEDEPKAPGTCEKFSSDDVGQDSVTWYTPEECRNGHNNPTTLFPDTTTPEPTTPPTTTPPTTTPTTTAKTTTTATTTSHGTDPTTTEPPATKAPPVAPSSSYDLHVGSFFGGMAVAAAGMAIGFVAWKFYKSRTERNYHTL